MDYLNLTNLYLSLEKTTKRLAKTALIATFLRNLKPKDDIPSCLYLLYGSVFPPWDARKIGVSDKLIIKTLASSLGFPPEKVEKMLVQYGDLGLVAEELIKHRKQTTLGQSTLTTTLIIKNLQKLATLEGEGTVARKVSLISELFTAATPIEARFITRTILEDLRIGIGEGTMRDAIVWAYFAAPLKIQYDEKENVLTVPDENKDVYETLLAKVQNAYDRTNDFAEVIQNILKHGAKSLDHIPLVPGRPVNLMLAIKVETPDDAVEALGLPVLCDFKLDGFRVQIHKNKDKVSLYTRRLENVTVQFQELVPIILAHVRAENCILDSEVVGYDPKTGTYIPFQDISQRIKRKYDIQALALKVPVEINVFDILYYNDHDMTEKTQAERRDLIEKIIKPLKGKIVPTRSITAATVKDIQQFYNDALKHGLEGIMIKSVNKPYTPGRKVGGWIKLKPVLENLDLVIVKAEYGSGKRAGTLSSYTIACLSKDKEQYLEIGKVSTGVKEKEDQGVSYTEITNLLTPLITKRNGKEVIVKPKIVIEVSYEEIQKSPSYAAGYALRFPRFVRLRTMERNAEDCNTLEDVERIYASQHTKQGKFHSKIQ